MDKTKLFLRDKCHLLDYFSVFHQLLMNTSHIAKRRKIFENTRSINIHEMGSCVRIIVFPLQRQKEHSVSVGILYDCPYICLCLVSKVFIGIKKNNPISCHFFQRKISCVGKMLFPCIRKDPRAMRPGYIYSIISRTCIDDNYLICRFFRTQKRPFQDGSFIFHNIAQGDFNLTVFSHFSAPPCAPGSDSFISFSTA